MAWLLYPCVPLCWKYIYYKPVNHLTSLQLFWNSNRSTCHIISVHIYMCLEKILLQKSYLVLIPFRLTGHQTNISEIDVAIFNFIPVTTILGSDCEIQQDSEICKYRNKKKLKGHRTNVDCRIAITSRWHTNYSYYHMPYISRAFSWKCSPVTTLIQLAGYLHMLKTTLPKVCAVCIYITSVTLIFLLKISS